MLNSSDRSANTCTSSCAGAQPCRPAGVGSGVLAVEGSRPVARLDRAATRGAGREPRARFRALPEGTRSADAPSKARSSNRQVPRRTLLHSARPRRGERRSSAEKDRRLGSLGDLVPLWGGRDVGAVRFLEPDEPAGAGGTTRPGSSASRSVDVHAELGEAQTDFLHHRGILLPEMPVGFDRADIGVRHVADEPVGEGGAAKSVAQPGAGGKVFVFVFVDRGVHSTAPNENIVNRIGGIPLPCHRSRAASTPATLQSHPLLALFRSTLAGFSSAAGEEV